MSIVVVVELVPWATGVHATAAPSPNQKVAFVADEDAAVPSADAFRLTSPTTRGAGCIRATVMGQEVGVREFWCVPANTHAHVGIKRKKEQEGDMHRQKRRQRASSLPAFVGACHMDIHVHVSMHVYPACACVGGGGGWGTQHSSNLHQDVLDELGLCKVVRCVHLAQFWRSLSLQMGRRASVAVVATNDVRVVWPPARAQQDSN